MSTLSPGGVFNAGIKRHYRGFEFVVFQLTDPVTGVPYTGGVTGTNLDPAHVIATVILPSGIIHVKSASPPNLTLTLGGDGMYRMVLWGEGVSGGHDVDLSEEGDCMLKIQPVGAEFNPLLMTYQVRSELDVQLAILPSVGPSDAPQITGCLSIHRWWSKDFLDFPVTAVGASGGRTTVVTALTIQLSDLTIPNIVQISGADLHEGADGNVYFTKPMLGLTGARAINARVTFNYKGKAFRRDFPIEIPLAA
jgi:hypothetical protein